jgi:hypothetical protein
VPSIDDYALPAPKDWEKLEDLLFDLYVRIWRDPNAQRVGRPGQAQDGVDIVGRPDQGSRIAGVQVRRKIGRLRPPELTIAVDDAKRFRPPLSHFTLATSAPNDTKLQQEALALTVRHAAEGLFDVTVMGWNEIERRMRDFPDLVTKWYGGRMPQAGGLPAEAPQLSLWFRDEGEVQEQNGRMYRVVSLLAGLEGDGSITDMFFQVQLPFLPVKLTQPIGPDRVIRPVIAGAHDGRDYRHWKDWRENNTVLGITFVGMGQVSMFAGLELNLCQFYLPVGWFSDDPRPRTYQCRYLLAYPPGQRREGYLPLDLFELVEGCY